MEDLHYFGQLKTLLLEQYRKRYPEWQEPLHAFGSREIRRFQELFEEKVGSTISERWVYTHLKTERATRLPRIDVLDLLAQMVGFADWQVFKARQQPETPVKTKRAWQVPALPLSGYWVLGLTALLLTLGWLQLAEKSWEYTICLEASAGAVGIDLEEAKLTIFRADESPEVLGFNGANCLHVHLKTDRVHFMLEAPYHHADTITRRLKNRKTKEVFQLTTDDYALMIHYFSKGSVEDWQQRRQQLDALIAWDAEIVQLSPDGTLGVALYDKEMFINKLTLPLSSLKNLRIIDTQYNAQGQIQRLRFVQPLETQKK